VYSHKNWRNHPQGFSIRVQKRVLFCFTVTTPTQPFGHLSCTDFDQIKHVNRCVYACTGEFQAPKQLKDNFELGVCVIEEQLKLHNC